MKYSNNALNILTLKTFKGIGDAWINKNIKNNLNDDEIINMLKNSHECKEPTSEKIFFDRKKRIENKILQLSENCDGVVSLGDEKFPSHRGIVKPADIPTAIFYKGDLNLLSFNNTNASVIGLLNPDPETETDERKIVYALVKENINIISGLAIGCDGIAHHEALCAGGKTVAILPSSLNNILPRQHITLARKIIENRGLIISEYYDNHTTSMELSGRYIRRDRLQALYSDIVILAASYAEDSIDHTAQKKLDSGSRHALKNAKDYGIRRGVIYDAAKNVHNPKYDLNRKIISETHAPIIFNPNQIELSITTFKANKCAPIFRQQKSLL